MKTKGGLQIKGCKLKVQENVSDPRFLVRKTLPSL